MILAGLPARHLAPQPQLRTASGQLLQSHSLIIQQIDLNLFTESAVWTRDYPKRVTYVCEMAWHVESVLIILVLHHHFSRPS